MSASTRTIFATQLLPKRLRGTVLNSKNKHLREIILKDTTRDMDSIFSTLVNSRGIMVSTMCVIMNVNVVSKALCNTLDFCIDYLQYILKYVWIGSMLTKIKSNQAK